MRTSGIKPFPRTHPIEPCWCYSPPANPSVLWFRVQDRSFREWSSFYENPRVFPTKSIAIKPDWTEPPNKLPYTPGPGTWFINSPPLIYFETKRHWSAGHWNQIRPKSGKLDHPPPRSPHDNKNSPDQNERGLHRLGVIFLNCFEEKQELSESSHMAILCTSSSH